MPKRNLDHAAVRIRSVDQSRRFYEGLLGLEPAERPELGLPGMWYTLGASQLHLIENESVSSGIDPTGPHFAIVVDDLDAVRERLTKSGFEILEIGSELFWVRDPDGNTVELRTANAFRR